MRIQLTPFEPSSFSVSAEILRDADSQVSVIYQVQGPVDQISSPPLTDHGRRRNELWKSTCFELFAKSKYSAAYVEFNFSESRDWNVYQFEDYRKGSAWLEVPAPPKIDCTRGEGALRFEVQLREDLFEDKGQIGITCILNVASQESLDQNDGGTNLEYWALKHCGQAPDFHDENSFTLKWS